MSLKLLRMTAETRRTPPGAPLAASDPEATPMKRIVAHYGCRCLSRRRAVRRRRVVGAPVRRGARERARRSRLHLPDAPGLPQRPSRRLPDLRHAPRGGSCGRGGGRRRRGSRAPAWRGAGESRAAAGDWRPAWRRQSRRPAPGCCGRPGAWRLTRTGRIQSSPP